MKKMRLPIYIALGVLVICFILGSFFDEQINQALFSRNNGFGLFASTIGTIPGYGCFAFCGGALAAFALRKIEKKPWKFVALFISVVAYGLGIYFSGKEFFGPNGFTNDSIYWLGFIIAAVIMSGLAYFGFVVGKKSDNDSLWIIILVLLVAYFIALIPGVTAIKNIFHRPRYRLVSTEEAKAAGLYFHNWWNACTGYKDYMKQLGVQSEEFKSFPSGHAGASAVFVMTVSFLPLFNKKYQKYQMPLFIGGCVWVIFVAFTRMLVGAHFLSDVSMGALLTMITLLIANEVVLHIKPLQNYLNPVVQVTEPVIDKVA